MRLPLSLLLCVLAACDNAVGPSAGEGSTIVNAIAIDSVTHQRVGSVAFTAGGRSAVSNRDGSFAFPSTSGADTVRLSVGGYEPFIAVLPAGMHRGVVDTLTFGLRRLGPFAVRCMMTEMGFRASIVDLRGRVPLDQFAASTVWLIDSTSNYHFPATGWQIQATNAVEWLVTIPDAPPHPVLTFWTLRDSTGAMHDGPCQTGEFQ